MVEVACSERLDPEGIALAVLAAGAATVGAASGGDLI
jgi:hypothetical protein